MYLEMRYFKPFASQSDVYEQGEHQIYGKQLDTILEGHWFLKTYFGRWHSQEVQILHLVLNEWSKQASK